MPIIALWAVLFLIMGRCAHRLGYGTGGPLDVAGILLALLIGIGLTRGGGWQ